MVEEGLPGVPKERGKLGPGIRRAHIHNSESRNPWARRLGKHEAWRLPCLHTAPELLFGGNQNAEVKWINRNRYLYPFSAARDYGKDRGAQMGNPHIVL